MTVYQNTDAISTGSRKTRTWWGDVESDPSTQPGIVSARNLVYREGQRRPKPKYLDDTPYELRLISQRNPSGLVLMTDTASPTFRREYSGVLNDLSVVDTQYRFGNYTAFNSELADLAKVRALSKLNHKDLDLGAAWKERGKTAQLVADVATVSVEALKALRKKDPNRLRDIFSGTSAQDVVSNTLGYGRNVSDGYLAYHYGVKPMLQDVAGAVQAMTRTPSENWRISSFGQASEDKRKRFSDMLGLTPVDLTTILRDGAKFHVSAVRKAVSDYEDMMWALGLDDQLSTAWELHPFSFVFDWIVPVGDWLAALNGSKYYTNWRCCLSQYRKETTTGRNTKRTVRTAEYKTHFSSPGYLETLRVKRSPSSVLPIVGVPVKNPASLDHMAKGLALFASTLARGGEPPRFIRG